MAQVKIYGLRESFAPIKSRLSETIQACLVEALGLSPENRYQRFFLMEPDDFIFPPDRTSRYTILEINMFEGRSVAVKKELIRLLYERLFLECGIRVQDLEITIFDPPKVNWGIRGLPGDEASFNYKVEM